MFTGIVTDIGRIGQVKPLNEGVLLRVETNYDPETIEIGASISCSGVCLTVTTLPERGSNARWFEAEAWDEALRLTTISGWKTGTRINHGSKWPLSASALTIRNARLTPHRSFAAISTPKFIGQL